MTSAGQILTDAVREYADEVAENFSLPVDADPEDQLKPLVGNLIKRVGAVVGDVNWRSEVHPDNVDGRPDLGITLNGLLVGHIELKRPGLGARPENFTGANKSQWRRFKELPNLIYTDGSEWSLYHSGKLSWDRVRISDDIRLGGAALFQQDMLAQFDRLLRIFLTWEPIVPGTAQGLAEFLAPLTRILRDEVRAELGRPDSPLRTLATEWGRLLFPGADDDQFADAYAQTLTYALLLARLEGAENLRPAMAVDALRDEHALLAEALSLLEVPSVREKLLMPVELLERAIAAVDSIQFEEHGDHWLYFYENFLGAYDPKLRKDRGVYFTPVEVVRCQVRLAGEILKTHFSKPLSFADDGVTVLDPAVGTGTYPLAVLDHADDAVRDMYGPGAVTQRIAARADRLYAFELLVGPYSVAHLRIAQRLREKGVAGHPPRVYLTDTLESPNRLPEFTATMMQEQISLERERAQEVKKAVPVVVCLGNPPYDREQRDPDSDEGRRKGGWVRYGDEGESEPPPILEDFLAPAREAGAGVHLKNLYNDYVYFWRWALWKVFDSTEEPGIVTFITASSYLRGPGFVGMRRKMREVFDELWIIDLEGDSLGARKTENVFAIRTPVAIAIGVRYDSPSPDTPANVHKVKLTGSEKEKLETLDSIESFDDLDWRECSSDWDAVFYPAGNGAYLDWPSITDVFPWQHSGVQFKRKWPIGETPDLLERRWRTLLSHPPEDRPRLFRETPDRNVRRESPRLLEIGSDPAVATLDADTTAPEIVPYAYRSFDRQYILRDARLGDRSRPVLHRVHSSQQLYMTGLLTAVMGHGPAAVATADIPDLDHFRGSFGGKHIMPLWRDAEATEPNVTYRLLEDISAVHGATISAERLFAYAYGILSQPEYVCRFWDELELPPPRLPITKDPGIFARVADHGERLLNLHTYGSVPQGEARCTKSVSLDEYPAGFHYDPSTKTLRVGDGEFAPVHPAIWSYSVSGLHVVKSWLDYRKLVPSGRKSSDLDKIRPERWTFGEGLLELLWLLEATVALEPEGVTLIDEVCASPLFSAQDLPSPTNEERKPPNVAPHQGEQLGMVSEDTS